jgi:hypothetical protein
MTSTETDKIDSFENFMDQYNPSISSTIAVLTGLANKEEVETLSVHVLVDLWKNNDLLFGDPRPTAFIYRTLLKHVFSWLKKKGHEERILLLRNTLLIDPVHYAHILD